MLYFQSGSGLFSLLPPPKNSSSAEKSGFVPHILLSKKEKPSTSSMLSKNKATPSSTPLKTTTPPISALTASEDQESDDENVSAKDSSNTASKCDFFWLDDLASKNETIVENPVLAPVKNGTFLQDLSSQLPCSSNSSIGQTYLNETNEDLHLQQHQQLPAVNVHQVEGNTDYISSEQQWQLIEESDGSKETLLNDKEVSLFFFPLSTIYIKRNCQNHENFNFRFLVDLHILRCPKHILT